jgi:excisionase family DNA binding protein
MGRSLRRNRECSSAEPSSANDGVCRPWHGSILDRVLAEIVAGAVADAVAPLVGALEAARAELAELRAEVRELRSRATPEHDYVYLTARQVAKRLGVSLRTVRRWITTGKLPCRRLPGGAVRVVAADLLALGVGPQPEGVE